MAEIDVSDQLNYKKKLGAAPSYKPTRIFPQQAIAGVPNGMISTAGGSESTFLIPTVGLNWARSILHFDLTPVGGTNYNRVFMDTLNCIQQIQLYNNAGKMLCDLQQVQNYTKVIWKPETKLVDFLNFDTFYGGVGAGRFLKRSNGLTNSAAAGSSAIRPAPAAAAPGTPASIPYMENCYLETGGNTTATPVLRISLPLSMLYNTIFAIDKDLYFNEILTLRIVWGVAAKVGFNTTAADATNAGQAAITSASISNLYLMLATEQNTFFVNELKAKIASAGGFSIPVPFVYFNKTTTSGTATQNTQMNINRGHGQRLLKIYHSIFPLAETLNDTYNNSRTAANLVSYYTQVNDQRLQDLNIELGSMMDWELMQKKCEGSLIQNSDIYRYNWYHLDDFSDVKPTSDSSADAVLKGLDLNTPITYYFFATCDATQYNHYDFIITQKMLNITAEGYTCQ